MKIAFVLPSVGKKEGRAYPRSWMMEPLGIGRLSAMTPSNWIRTFHDDRLESIPYDQPTDLVAINVETYTARRAYQIAREYRARGTPVVMGGFHATLVPEEVQEHADGVVIGEAESVWPALLDDFAGGRLQRFYRAAERPLLKGLRPDRTIYAGRPYMGLSLVETARGCRFSCEFCSIAGFYRSTYTSRPVEEVVEEIRETGARNVFFVDDNLCVDRERTRRLLEALLPLRIRWMCQVSISAAQDESLLALMRRSGCVGVLIGFESLDPAPLAAMGKTMNPVTEAEAEKAVRRFYRHGIAIFATFVFGYDTDTAASFKRTLRFAVRQGFFFAAFNHIVPFPGTPLYARLKREGRLLNEPWWLNDAYRFGDVAFQPAGMRPDELRDYCLEYRLRFYSLSSIARRFINSRANSRSPFLAGLYWMQNLAGRRETLGRYGLPLGFPTATERPAATDGRVP